MPQTPKSARKAVESPKPPIGKKQKTGNAKLSATIVSPLAEELLKNGKVVQAIALLEGLILQKGHTPAVEANLRLTVARWIIKVRA